MPVDLVERPYQARYQPHKTQSHSEHPQPLKPVRTSRDHRANEQFKAHVAKRNRHAAITAFSAQHEPSDNREIVVPCQRMLARRAVRAGSVDAKDPPLFSLFRSDGYSIQNHIQERTNARTEEKPLNAPKPRRQERIIQKIIQIAGLPQEQKRPSRGDKSELTLATAFGFIRRICLLP